MPTTSRSRSKKHSSSKRSKRVHRKQKVNKTKKTKKTKKSVRKMKGGFSEIENVDSINTLVNLSIQPVYKKGNALESGKFEIYDRNDLVDGFIKPNITIPVLIGNTENYDTVDKANANKNNINHYINNAGYMWIFTVTRPVLQ